MRKVFPFHAVVDINRILRHFLFRKFASKLTVIGEPVSRYFGKLLLSQYRGYPVPCMIQIKPPVLYRVHDLIILLASSFSHDWAVAQSRRAFVVFAIYPIVGYQ